MDIINKLTSSFKTTDENESSTVEKEFNKSTTEKKSEEKNETNEEIDKNFYFAEVKNLRSHYNELFIHRNELTQKATLQKIKNEYQYMKDAIAIRNSSTTVMKSLDNTFLFIDARYRPGVYDQFILNKIQIEEIMKEILLEDGFPRLFRSPKFRILILTVFLFVNANPEDRKKRLELLEKNRERENVSTGILRDEAANAILVGRVNREVPVASIPNSSIIPPDRSKKSAPRKRKPAENKRKEKKKKTNENEGKNVQELKEPLKDPFFCSEKIDINDFVENFQNNDLVF